MKLTQCTRPLTLVVAAVLVAGLVAGCAQKAEQSTTNDAIRGVAPASPETAVGSAKSGELAADSAAPQTSGAESATSAATSGQDRMIVRSQTLRLEVVDTAKTVEKLRELASKHSAVITDMQVATDSDQWLYRYDESGMAIGDGAALRGWVTVRVPAESLDGFVEGARAFGTVRYQSENTSDVTEQHVDLTARLDNLRAEEARLRTFFDSAKTVQDMLLVEAELNRVRGEIEAMTAQITYLERQAAMATVTIEITEKQAVVRPEGENWGFRDAITSGIRGAANVITFALAFALATSPLWLVGLLALFIVRGIIRRRRAKRGADSGTATEQ